MKYTSFGYIFSKHYRMIANTPAPPYFAVIFTSLRTEGDNGYAEMSNKMISSVTKQTGFLGFESAREETGITVSYWKDLDSIKQWKENFEHSIARNLGREKWYTQFTVRICRVDNEYSWKK